MDKASRSGRAGFTPNPVTLSAAKGDNRSGSPIQPPLWLVLPFFVSLPLSMVSLAYGLPWNTDMYWHPFRTASKGPHPPAQHTVPITGIEPSLSSRLPARIKAGMTLDNPVPVTPRSVQNGASLFQIYCTPCHGPHGRGDGPVVGKTAPSSDLHTDRIKQRPDGYLYATIRAGGFIMPSYKHVLSSQERWDLVNYIRHVQAQ